MIDNCCCWWQIHHFSYIVTVVHYTEERQFIFKRLILKLIFNPLYYYCFIFTCHWHKSGMCNNPKSLLSFAGCLGEARQRQTCAAPWVHQLLSLDWWMDKSPPLVAGLFDLGCVAAGDLWESQSLGKGAAEAGQSKHRHCPSWQQSWPCREEASGVWGNTLC